ncbi:hypothetical protein R1sor_009838 [Riccia sorocarpa]|uniref:Uncharacterized protein n=1 Tax=Riccia sorocarpa TaxID=122646 RepID=A0ABD3HW85_9MARC
MEIDVGEIRVESGNVKHAGVRPRSQWGVDGERHVVNQGRVGPLEAGASGGAWKALHSGLPQDPARSAREKQQAWSSIVANNGAGESKGGTRKRDEGEEEVDSTGGVGKEKEPCWEEGITWEILAAELSSMKTLETLPGDNERIVRMMNLDISKASRKLGKFHTLAQENPGHQEPVNDAGVSAMGASVEDKSASAGGFTEVRSKSRARKGGKPSQAAATRNTDQNPFQALEVEDPIMAEEEARGESSGTEIGGENSVRRAVAELRREQGQLAKKKKHKQKKNQGLVEAAESSHGDSGETKGEGSEQLEVSTREIEVERIETQPVTDVEENLMCTDEGGRGTEVEGDVVQKMPEVNPFVSICSIRPEGRQKKESYFKMSAEDLKDTRVMNLVKEAWLNETAYVRDDRRKWARGWYRVKQVLKAERDAKEKIRREEGDLEKEVAWRREVISEDPSPAEVEMLHSLEQRLKIHDLEDAKRWRLRSRVSWLSTEDAPSRYFFAKLRAKWAKESLRTIELDDGTVMQKKYSKKYKDFTRFFIP